LEKKSEGFVRWVEAKDGSLKRLPTAEYNMANTSLTRAEVLERQQTLHASPFPTLPREPAGEAQKFLTSAQMEFFNSILSKTDCRHGDDARARSPSLSGGGIPRARMDTVQARRR
jgi:hypothetical protein